VGLYLTRSGELITWRLEDFLRLLGAEVPVSALRIALASRILASQ